MCKDGGSMRERLSGMDKCARKASGTTKSSIRSRIVYNDWMQEGET